MNGKLNQSIVKLAPFSLTAIIIACGFAADAPTTSPSTAPTTAPAVSAIATPTGFKPLTYFQTSCAKCHGDYGDGYVELLDGHLTTEQLQTAIYNMAHGPGNAPINERELAVQLLYHQALVAKTPFAVVTKISIANDKATIEGEADPATKITIGGTAATMDGHTWTAGVPAAKVYTIEAVVGEKKMTFDVTP